ncbi:MAG TPA: hypothetical protein VMB21_18360 [Candidatus Limnocylindria bacterium]|jgi:hypothetical protein|nr:hypothetical protein [Candidatus Limnocylindria bacterium]
MDSEAGPQLAPPGAGLPTPELYIARLLMGWQRLTGDRESFNRKFQREREAIRQVVRSCDDVAAAKRVLIRRPPGLEDSSRYWSVWMTLDHLRIVNGQITKVIGALARGIIPPGEASTAAVKPTAALTASVVSDYETACDELVATVAAVPELKTRVRFNHPWFGPMDALGWHGLASSHMGLHRVQIERILQALARK